MALALLTLLGVPGQAGAAPAPPLDHEGRWITDARGRVTILHGWNMVYKVGSYRPAEAGFGRDDARFLARNGFNTVRLGIIHRGLEPRPPGPGGEPRYRRGYLRSIARTERVLADRGIHTLLDFHQDLYSERFEGEGFPAWAVVGDARTLPAEPKQGFPANYLGMRALNRAFDHFWANDRTADGRPLQQAYAAAWRHVAKRFRGADHVLGYNLLNEPWPGSQYPSCVSPTGCPAFDRGVLEPFSERVIDAIRTVDRRTLVWYAPLLTFDFGADTSHGDTGDSNAGFAFNMYCLSDIGGGLPAPPGPPGADSCDTGYDLALDNAEAQSRETGDALLLTEFAATDELATVRADRRARRRADGLVAAVALLRVRRPHHHGEPGERPGARRGPVQAADREQRQVAEAQGVGAAVSEGGIGDAARVRLRLPERSGSTSGTRRGGGRPRSLPGGLHHRGLPAAAALPRRLPRRVRGADVASRPGATVLKLEGRRGAKRVSVLVRP